MYKSKISIIIPFYFGKDGEFMERFLSDINKFYRLKYTNFEIIIVVDKKVKLPKLLKTRVVNTGLANTGPAEKRDLALKFAKGKYCAFIDDDAYPDKNWLTNAVLNFQDKRVAAVGGPGVTPPEDTYWQKLTGYVYESYFCGGNARHRFVPEKIRFVEDFPAYNLIVRKDVLAKVGGYGNYFYGGEDTFLCLKLIKAGYRILYDPKVVVYHHRRALFTPYLKQISNVGIHRGYFAKRFPETSFIYFYFIPAFLAVGFFSLLFLSLFSFQILILFLTLVLFFLFIGFISTVKKTNSVNAFLVSLSIILTHLVYGLSFLKGLSLQNLKR